MRYTTSREVTLLLLLTSLLFSPGALRSQVADEAILETHELSTTRHLSFHPNKSKVTFTLGAVLHTVHGTARLTSGDVNWSVASNACSGTLVIDAQSLDTGNVKRDRLMHGKVLESDTFPTIEFSCESYTGELNTDGKPVGDFTVQGAFLIHGDSHAISIPMRLEEHTNQVSITGAVEIPYVAWGMKDPSKPFLRAAKVVEIQLELIARSVTKED